MFFYGVQGFINRNALEAVDERRRDQHTDMDLAISVHDLQEKKYQKTFQKVQLFQVRTIRGFNFGQLTLISNLPSILLESSM